MDPLWPPRCGTSLSDGVSRLARAALVGACLAGALVATADGAPAPDLIAAGRRLYREGRLPSGALVAAHVEGDVPIDGGQFTCQSCHRRSGMGTSEGGRVVPALAGPLLFAPDAQRARPAYTEELLARALRSGVDAAGRHLDPLMPRYDVSDADVASLAAYLRLIGSRASPGTENDTLRFATVVADDVPPAVQQAMLDVLNAYFSEKNAQTRQEARRSLVPHAPRQALNPYLAWSLDVWRLSGPPQAWRAQMEARYRERPAFALISGAASGPWGPVHDFCEDNQVPCLLPNTDLPPASESGYYSLYFSGGLRLEAEILAGDIAQGQVGTEVVQVLGRGDPRAAFAAAALEEALGRRGGRARRLVIDGDAEGAFELRPMLESGASAVVLWLPAATIRQVAPPLSARTAPHLYFSSGLLGGDWSAVPERLRDRSSVVHLLRLPSERDPPLERYRAWARGRGLRVAAEGLQAQTYFACLAAGDGSKHLGRFPFREFFLDLLDHDAGLTAYLPLYPRGTQGPGQRFLARGGYVVDLSHRREPRWVVP